MSEQGKTPSESAIEQNVVAAEDSHTSETRHVVSAYLTFVALGNDGKPHSVPPVLPQTKAEIRRFEAAGTRREQRLRNKANRRYA